MSRDVIHALGDVMAATAEVDYHTAQAAYHLYMAVAEGGVGVDLHLAATAAGSVGATGTAANLYRSGASVYAAASDQLHAASQAAGEAVHAFTGGGRTPAPASPPPKEPPVFKLPIE
jgi:hypothetical protein